MEVTKFQLRDLQRNKYKRQLKHIVFRTLFLAGWGIFYAYSFYMDDYYFV